MKLLRPGLDLDAFFDKLADAPARTLLLDYDGTLAPFREERDEAVPYEGLREAVQDHLDDSRSRVVIVSGREIEVLRSLLGIEPPPEMWGSHGWERYTAEDGLVRADPGDEARDGLEQALAAASSRVPEERVEVKPVSVAVHSRGLDHIRAASLLDDVRRPWRAIASGGGLELHDFDGGLELRVPGRDKGTAVRDILADTPPGGIVAYLGDDRTDEDAFEVLEGLGDRALRVLVREEMRETKADLWIRPPGELLEFLQRWRRHSGS